jgi:hypothetical protein
LKCDEAKGIEDLEFRGQTIPQLDCGRALKALVICLDNSGYEASLERLDVYVAIPDFRAEQLGQIRIVDESGEDYLYPRKNFSRADLAPFTPLSLL